MTHGRTTERMATLIQALLRHSEKVLEMGQSRGVFHVTFCSFVLIKPFTVSLYDFYRKLAWLSFHWKENNWKKTEEFTWLGSSEEELGQETTLFFLLLWILLPIASLLPYSASPLSSPQNPFQLWVNSPWLLAQLCPNSSALGPRIHNFSRSLFLIRKVDINN